MCHAWPRSRAAEPAFAVRLLVSCFLDLSAGLVAASYRLTLCIIASAHRQRHSGNDSPAYVHRPVRLAQEALPWHTPQAAAVHWAGSLCGWG